MAALKTLLCDETDILESVTTAVQDITQINAEYQNARGARRERLRSAITSKVDALLGILMSEFPARITSEEATKLFSEHLPLTKKCLARLNPSQVPLVVMRELIATHEVVIDRHNIKNWRKFTLAYYAEIP